MLHSIVNKQKAYSLSTRTIKRVKNLNMIVEISKILPWTSEIGTPKRRRKTMKRC